MNNLSQMLKYSSALLVFSFIIVPGTQAADGFDCILSPGCQYIGYTQKTTDCSSTSPICPLDAKWAQCLKTSTPPSPTDPCVGLTPLSIPDNASCAEYSSSCSSVCTRWECNSGYASSKSGTRCYKTIPCKKGSLLYSDLRCYDYGGTDLDLMAIVIDLNKAIAMGINPVPNKTFDEAKSYCSSLNSGQWQSPSRTDLMNTADSEVSNALSYLAFLIGRPYLSNMHCWTSTEAPEYGSDKAWFYGILSYDNWASKSSKYYACPIIQGFYK